MTFKKSDIQHDGEISETFYVCQICFQMQTHVILCMTKVVKTR